MRSRYDLMKYSDQRASDGSFYRDVMSFKINKFRLIEAPAEYYLNEVDVKRQDILAYNLYAIAEFDDLLLWLNKISNIRNVEIGDKIFVPSKIDVENFYLENRE